MTLGIIITCHAAYLPMLPMCLAAWEAQGRDLTRCVLVLDGVAEEELEDPEGWEVVRVRAGNPNPARNAGLLRCATEWVIFWDADNVPPTDYAARAVAAARLCPRVTGAGVLAPAVRRAGTARLENPALWGGDARECGIVDTGSVWRREAALQAGGWVEQSGGYDDWALAKEMVCRGWRILPLAGVTLVLEEHEGRRGRVKDAAQCRWTHRRLGIITLMAGRMQLVERWLEGLRTLSLPPRCGLTVMLPEGRPGLRRLVGQRVEEMMEGMERPFSRVTLLTADRPALMTAAADGDGYRFLNKHRAVGALYAQALAATPEEAVLTWEDDTFPRQADALERLHAAWGLGQRVAAVAAAYPRRRCAAEACAARYDGFQGIPKMAELADKVYPMASVPYGFTLWSRAALEQCPMLCGEREPGGRLVGLDPEQCRRLALRGWRLLLHGGVRCDHETDLEDVT